MQMKSTASRMLLGVIVLVAAVAPAFSQTATSASADEVNALKEQIAAQQKQIEQLVTTMEEMKQRLDQATKPTPAAAQPQTPNLGEVASTTPVVPVAKTATADAIAVPVASPAASPAAPANGQAETPPTSPLEFHLGKALFRVGGFLDATAFFRTTNVGSGIGTSFGGIPYSNAVAGRLTETRFSAQNSRLTFMFQTPVGDSTNIKAYVESDFLGFQPSNGFETSNSDSFRLRLYWAQLTHGKFEFLAGQT